MALTLHGYPDWQRPFNTGDLNTEVTSAALATGLTLDTGLLDMRPYNSFGVRFDVRRGGVDANLRTATPIIAWAEDGFENASIYEDRYAINAQNAVAGGGSCNNGILYVHGPIMGPYARFQVVNSSPVTLSADIQVIGNSRVLPGQYAREVAAALTGNVARSDTILIAETMTVNAGATNLRALRLLVGRVYIAYTTTTQAGTFSLTTADGKVIDSQLVAAGVTTRFEMVFPMQSMALRINNASAANASYTAVVIHQAPTW